MNELGTSNIKTATITFHAPINYGAFLQAYALQQALINKIGVQNEIIDYQSAEQKNEYAIIRNWRSFRNIVRNIFVIPHIKSFRKRVNAFKTAREKLLQTTKEINSVFELDELKDSYDCYICGSDQIWNTALLDYSEAYFLPGFSPKISYAVSLGKRIQESTKAEIHKYINEFNSVSIREDAGLTIVKRDYTGKEPSVVCDPVLLLAPEEWISFIKHHSPLEPNTAQKYIFAYSINYSEPFLSAVNEISKKLKLRVITAYGGNSAFAGLRIQRKGFKVDYEAGPIEFIDYIYNSELVITDSFHGTVFSILLHKPLYSFHQRKNDVSVLRDERIDHLLDLLSINDKTISFYNDEFHYSSDLRFDWNAIDNILYQIRENSLLWLNTSIHSSIQEGKAERVELYESKNQCCGCGACSNICPVEAIHMIPDNEGFLYPSINKRICIGCRQCQTVCVFKLYSKETIRRHGKK